MNLYKTLVFLFKPLIYLFFRVKIVNKNSLPENRGILLCSNHASYLDPAFLTIGQRRQIFYMAKDELFKIPVLGFIFKKMGAFAVKRGTGDKAAIQKAKEIIESGRVLGIFPEGTRSKTGQLLRFRSGAAVLAQRTGADVMPAAIIYKGKARLFCKVTVVFGDIITNEELGLGDDSPGAIKNATRIIMERVSSLREEYM